MRRMGLEKGRNRLRRTCNWLRIRGFGQLDVLKDDILRRLYEGSQLRAGRVSMYLNRLGF